MMSALWSLVGLSVLAVSMGLVPTDRATKQKALHEPVCLIPMGESIDVADLPKSVLRTNWMRKLKDEQLVSLVSIPATHDAGTALGRLGYTRCQVLTIPAQLAVGVRGLDVRLRLVDRDLSIYHAEEPQKVRFADVMRGLSDFLKAHPSEFIVMRIREEAKAIRPTESFEAAFARYTEPYGSLFFKASSRTEIPSVGALRGKILLLDNYGKLPNAVDYPNAAMSVQDDYDTSDMEHKYQEIIAKFEDALNQKGGAVWQVNYTSSCNAVVDQLANAKAVNAKVLDFLRGKKGNLGLVLFNFPSVDAIHAVLDSNF
jgi:1-phosphatidylinositol phosphodiesterase